MRSVMLQVLSAIFSATITASLALAGGGGQAFTYQGELRFEGEPVAGPVNFAFRLYDAEVAGDQVGSELVSPAFSDFDTAGRFTIDLDFGVTSFGGDPRWLEVRVNGVPLTPRQPILPAPYALRALNVAQVSDPALAGTYTNAVNLTNPGNSFAGNGALLTGLNASHVAAGSLSAARLPTGGNWGIASNLNIGTGALVVVPATKRIGIGTASPTSPLTVIGPTTSGVATIFATHPEPGTNTPAILGTNTDTSGAGVGVEGRGSWIGVRAVAALSDGGGAQTGSRIGVLAENEGTADTFNYGVRATVGPGQVSVGVYGGTAASNGRAIFGEIFSGSGEGVAVYGSVLSPQGYSAYFEGAEGSRSFFQRRVGIGELHPAAPLHVTGVTTGSATPTIFADEPRTFSDTPAIRGENIDTNGWGIGVEGISSFFGVFGRATTSSSGGPQTGQRTGVYGRATNIQGTSNIGVFGEASEGEQNIGVYGSVSSANIGPRYAGYFTGGAGSYNYFQQPVGVGTLAPLADLHVDALSGNADLFLRASGATNGFNIGVSNLPMLFLARYDGTTYTDRVAINGSNGNVGLGLTNPTFQLHLSQNSAAKPTSNTWTISSDVRLKKDIATIDGALHSLLALRGVTYRWIDPSSQGGMAGTYTGFIAQEVETVFPQWIGEDEAGFRTLNVIGFEGLVVEALRELREEHAIELAVRDAEAQAQRREYAAEMSARDAELDRLRADLEALRAMVERQ